MPKFLTEVPDSKVKSIRSRSVVPYFWSWCFDLKMIYSVLSSFNLSSCMSIQDRISCMHLLSWSKARSRSPGIAGSKTTYSWVSSAYIWYLTKYFLHMAAIGIVYAVKSTGPSTEPCGTPRVNRTNQIQFFQSGFSVFYLSYNLQTRQGLYSQPQCAIEEWWRHLWYW